ncbi:hypothetical phage protein, partial [Clostridium botulinum A str. ATCC 3502]
SRKLFRKCCIVYIKRQQRIQFKHCIQLYLLIVLEDLNV